MIAASRINRVPGSVWAMGRVAALVAGVLGFAACDAQGPESDVSATQSAVYYGWPNVVSPLGTFYRPDGAYGGVTLDDIESSAKLGVAYYDANPTRLAAVMWAINEARLGQCGQPAAKKYGAYYCLFANIFDLNCWYGEWCSEFALWILHKAGIDPSSELTGITLPKGSVTTPATRAKFSSKGLFWGRDAMTPAHYGAAYHFPRPGDYLFMVGSSGDHFGHSGIVVGVSNDSRHIFTVEGNNSDCVTFERHDYFVDGVLNDGIDGFGSVQPWANATRTYPHTPLKLYGYGYLPDPVCSRGILSVESGACCPPWCGSCGGSGCSGRTGGAADCCVGNILAANVSCATTGSGCVVTDPDCAYGSPSSEGGVCCAASCGSCGGPGCGARPGGSSACCMAPITNANMSCIDKGAPCMVQ